MKAAASALGLVLVLGLVPACKGRLEIVASCNMRKTGVADTNSQICMDLSNTRLDKLKELCAAQGNEWASKACDRKEALGGCRDDASITWYFPSAKDKTADDIKKECYGDAKFVGPDYVEPAK